MRIALVPVLLALALASGPAAGADEVHMADGEVLYGAVEARTQGTLRLRTADGVRTLRTEDVARHLEGEAPLDVVARKEAAGPTDAQAVADLAAYAWRHRLDAAARRLAGVAVARDPSAAFAQALLGRHRVGDDWVAGWPLPLSTSASPGPRWGAARKRAAARGGATAASEAAVVRALDWLAAHQDEDGKLDADGFQRHDPADDRTDGQGGGHHGGRVPCPYDGVTTSVALMAWLASGSTPVSGPYAEPVARALGYATAVVASGPRGAYGLWNHGFCTQAVADAYAVTRDPALRPVLEDAVRGILRLQLEDGGWSYYMPVGDVPTTAVAALALARAGRAGVVLPRASVERLLGFLDARIDPATGRSEYHAGAERKGYTPTRANAAAALAVRAALGVLDDAPRRGKQIGAIRQKPVWKIEFKDVQTKDGRTVRAQIGNLYPYQWGYATSALFAHGGATWKTWFAALSAALRAGQREDGAAAGSWDPLGTYSDSAGRVYVTGLCALMLQSPYRFARDG